MNYYKASYIFLAAVSFLSIKSFGQFSERKNILNNITSVSSIFWQDLDQDGMLDLIASSSEDHKIIWHRYLGGENYSNQQIIYEGTERITNISVGDIDSDGDLDIAAVFHFTDRAVWFENLGDEQFSTPIFLNSSLEGAIDISIYDFDYDGDQDLLIANKNSNNLSLFLNQGDNLFNDQIIIPASPWPSGIHLSDINNDGYMDFFVRLFTYTEEVLWFENDGNGEFTQHIVVTQIGSTDIQAVDVNNDGNIDLMNFNQSQHKIYWYENDGYGNFTIGDLVIEHNDDITSVWTGDVDGDLDNDFVFISSSPTHIHLMRNNGNEEFLGLETFWMSFEDFDSVLGYDYDQDGDNDLITTKTAGNSNRISVHPNTGEGDFLDQIQLSEYADFPWDAIALDMDNDGDNDVLTISKSHKEVIWFENSGDSETQFIGQHLLHISNDVIFHYAIIDVDQDSDMDIVMYTDSELYYLANLGEGIYSEKIIIENIYSSLQSGKIIVAELTGDEIPDLVIRTGYMIKVYPGQVDGGYEVNETNEYSTVMYSGSFNIGDGDNDGDNDLIISYPGSSEANVTYFENLSDGTFSEEQVVFGPSQGIGESFLNDIDEDEDIDLVCVTSSGIGYYENNGTTWYDGDFITITNFGANKFEIYDIDNDGDMDLFGGQQAGQQSIWIENLGEGIFSEIQTFNNFNPPRVDQIMFYDLDSDNDIDVLTVSFNANELDWYENELNEGCSNNFACNYNSNATIDDGSCEFSSCIDCIGDLNFDEVIDITDLTLFLENFGCDLNCIGDTDGDSDVDVLDLVNLINSFGVPCE